MAVYSCSGVLCPRSISVSAIPGGNPVALEDPEHWSIRFTLCADCRSPFCDRCVGVDAGVRGEARCPACRGPLVDGTRMEEFGGRPVPAAIIEHRHGMEAARSGDLTTALAAFDRSLEMRPDYVRAHFSRGAALQDLGRMAEAVAAYDRVIRLEPGNMVAHFNRALTLAALGRTREAISGYGQAIAAHPRYASPLVNRALLLNETGRPREALADCDRAIDLDESGRAVDDSTAVRTAAYVVRCAILAGLGRDQEALEAIDAAIDSGPDSPHLYRNRAAVLRRLGRVEEALLAARLADEVERDLGADRSRGGDSAY